MQENPGYAVASAAYVAAWLEARETPAHLAPGVNEVVDLVKRRLDDDDATGFDYVKQSPDSVRARRTLTRDIEQILAHDQRFRAQLRTVVDRLGAAGGLDHLVTTDAAAVVSQVIDDDRRGEAAYRPGLVAALGPAAPEALLGTAARARAAAAGDRQGPAGPRLAFNVLFTLAVVGLLGAFAGGVIQNRPVLFGFGILFVIAAVPTTILYRTRASR
jgi:hypothetical protein